MKWSAILLVAALLGACAHLRGGGSEEQRRNLWNEAHLAFHAEDFRHSREVFQRLADEFPESNEGREAVFYLGALRLDPRNPQWNPQSAQEFLRQYLALDTTRAVIFRRPEATTLLRLAEQLTAPLPDPAATNPAAATQPPRATPRVANPEQVRALQAENAELRRQLNERDETIRRLREELERIRRTLTPRGP